MSRERAKQIRATVDQWYATIYGLQSKDIPKENDDNVANFVDALWRDSKDWRLNSFFGRMGYTDPFAFWRDCRKLEEGAHWEVWGRRNVEAEGTWKQELVDDEISNQIRVRKSYLTANWHDITILPNLKDLTIILDQERGRTKWGPKMVETVHRGLTEGMAVRKTVLDRSLDPDGLADELLLDNAGIFPTPFSSGIKRAEGSWHLIHAELQTVQQIMEEWPQAEGMSFEQSQEDIAKYLRLDLDKEYKSNYTNTKLIPVMRLYMDDPQVIRAAYDQEEIDLEHEALSSGHKPDASDDNNHVQHIKQHLDYIDSLHQLEPQGQDDAELRDAQTELTAMHIEEHHKAIQKKKIKGLSPGAHQKYPYGRFVTTIGGLLVEDKPNPFGMDWRRLFHVWYCEKIPGSWWGRGVPEILWNTNRVEDTMLSRTADIALSVGIPKEYFNIDDKDAIEEQGRDNDPLKPLFVKTAPTFRSAKDTGDNMLIYNSMKANAQKTQAISGVSYGQAQNAQQSGKLVETLLQQSQVIITGEANQRLSETIEGMIETRIEFYKRFYNEPRWYFIHGRPVALNLSEMFTKWKVVDPQGSVKEETIPQFEITVRPNSNFPQRFESQLAFLLQLAQSPSPDGTPFVPREAILDIVANLYPQLGRDGEYYHMAEALKIGMQVIAEKQKKEAADQRTMKTVAGALRKEGVKAALGTQEVPTGGSNGGSSDGA